MLPKHLPSLSLLGWGDGGSLSNKLNGVHLTWQSWLGAIKEEVGEVSTGEGPPTVTLRAWEWGWGKVVPLSTAEITVCVDLIILNH